MGDASLVVSFLIALAINNKVTAITSLLIICDENTVTGRWFPSLDASNAEIVLMLWRHPVLPGAGMAAVYVSSQVAVCRQFTPARTALATLFISFSGNIGVIIFISCYQCFFYSDGKPANQKYRRVFLDTGCGQYCVTWTIMWGPVCTSLVTRRRILSSDI